MNWQTIYDVQHVNSQGGAANGIFVAAILFGLPGLCMLLFGRSVTARFGGYMLFLAVPGMAIISMSEQQYYRRLKQEMAAGQIVELVGVVDDAHWQSVGKGRTFVFSVDGTKFYLSEFYPANCWPYPGQQVDIATEPESARQLPIGAPILRMRVEAGSCQAPPRTPAPS